MLVLFGSLLTAIIVMGFIAMQVENSTMGLESSLVPVRVDESKRNLRSNWRN
ncbi:MAG: hypothetical protein AB4038_01860 [Prochloraceae cyanobacterium]